MPPTSHRPPSPPRSNWRPSATIEQEPPAQDESDSSDELDDDSPVEFVLDCREEPDDDSGGEFDVFARDELDDDSSDEVKLVVPDNPPAATTPERIGKPFARRGIKEKRRATTEPDRLKEWIEIGATLVIVVLLLDLLVFWASGPTNHSAVSPSRSTSPIHMTGAIPSTSRGT